MAQFVHGWGGRLRKSHRGRRSDGGHLGQRRRRQPHFSRSISGARGLASAAEGKLFDLRPEMDCLVHQEGCKVKPNVDLAIRPEQELVQLAITKQQSLEAEVEARDCVDWLPSLLGSLYPYGIRPSQENRGPLADLMFLADDEQLLARGAVVSIRHVLSRLSRMFRKFPATSGLHSESCSRFTGC
jgi:hypothetical protein